MSNPSWKQLAAIPESLTKRNVLQALGVEPPPEGISERCDLGDVVFWNGEAGLIVERKCDNSTCYMGAMEALRKLKLSKGTPSGDLARWWLLSKGFLL